MRHRCPFLKTRVQLPGKRRVTPSTGNSVLQHSELSPGNVELPYLATAPMSYGATLAAIGFIKVPWLSSETVSARDASALCQLPIALAGTRLSRGFLSLISACAPSSF